MRRYYRMNTLVIGHIHTHTHTHILPLSGRLLLSPRRVTRKISKTPFKVLDAPELQDDFYLNLLDWSSQNTLSVGLGTSVYLWSACTCQVCVGVGVCVFAMYSCVFECLYIHVCMCLTVSVYCYWCIICLLSLIYTDRSQNCVTYMRKVIRSHLSPGQSE